MERQAQRETVKTQREGSHLLATDRGLSRNQPCQHTSMCDFWPPQLCNDKVLLCEPPRLWRFVVTAPANWNSCHCGINTRFYTLQPFLLGAFINTYYMLYWREWGTLLYFEAQNLNQGLGAPKNSVPMVIIIIFDCTMLHVRVLLFPNQGLNPCSPTLEVQSLNQLARQGISLMMLLLFSL